MLLKNTFYLLAILLTISGCVTQSRYDRAVSDFNETQKELSATRTQVDNLRADNDGLRLDIEALKLAIGGDLNKLTMRLSELRAERDGFRVDLADLNTQMSILENENEYLNREVDRLMVVAGELSIEKERKLAEVTKAYDELVDKMRTEIESGEVKIVQAVDKLSVHFVEKILFDSGKAEIKPNGMVVLKKVGGVLTKSLIDHQIRVEGHTDNVPIGPKLLSKFATNWELSTMRATTIVRYLQDDVGIDPKVLSAAGYSLYKPVADNETPEGRFENRRIEIVLLPLDVDRVLEELAK